MVGRHVKMRSFLRGSTNLSRMSPLSEELRSFLLPLNSSFSKYNLELIILISELKLFPSFTAFNYVHMKYFCIVSTNADIRPETYEFCNTYVIPLKNFHTAKSRKRVSEERVRFLLFCSSDTRSFSTFSIDHTRTGGVYVDGIDPFRKFINR